MSSLEIPVGKRTLKYRIFEILPGVLSYGVVLTLVGLSLWDAVIASIYLLVIIITMLVRAVSIAAQTLKGYDRLHAAYHVNWHTRLKELEKPADSLKLWEDRTSRSFGHNLHMQNLQVIAEDSDSYPKPSELTHAVIVAAYNESVDVIEPTIKSLCSSSTDGKQMIVVFAYEQRGGSEIKKTAQYLKRKYGQHFAEFYTVMHPEDLPKEVVGKGGNITYAGKYLAKKLKSKKIDFSNVIVTTLDCDNHPHRAYFDYVSYEYIVHKDRKNLSYQPISLFLNNIWDVPAPMRVIATGNSFWNIISSMRPHMLRNFASHSQPLDALYEMDFWSTRTIVEDGHQYWRSYFHFDGDYRVVPVYIPIYQDAVLSETYKKTLYAQFKQLRRWAYGASDVPYVASRIFTRKRRVPLVEGLIKFWELLDGHITLATVSIMVALGGWIPLLLNPESARSVSAHRLPDVVSSMQQIALLGLCISIFLAFKMLPPRPERYKRSRSFLMIIQWVLMPLTAICYGSISALNAQTHLLLGKYLDKFDVTEKAKVKAKTPKKAK